MRIQIHNMSNIRINKGSLLVLLIFILSVSAGCGIQKKEFDESDATTQAIESLTYNYGKEVSQIIESFIRKAGSLDAHRNQSVLKELLTEERLLLYPTPDLDSEPYWIVTKSANVDHIRVIEYIPDRIKAITCLTIIYEERSVLEGELLKTYPASEHCVLYVFVSEEGNWKLKASFDTTVPENVARDWAYTSEWLKEAIGELPDDPSMLRERK